jgi:hypothetical protein
MPDPVKEIELLLREPLVDPTRGWTITQKWFRAFTRGVRAVAAGAAGTIWSSVGGETDWRSLASLMAAGMVVQIQVGTYAVEVSNSTSVYTDTGLAVAITPQFAASRILVFVAQNGFQKDTGDTSLQLKLLRDAATIATFADGAGNTASAATMHIGSVVGIASDLPATLNPVTYKTQFASKANIAQVRMQRNNVQSTIVLVEVKQ